MWIFCSIWLHYHIASIAYLLAQNPQILDECTLVAVCPDRDEIMASSCYYYSIQVTITVWVDGSVTSKEVTLQCDLSIVGVDNIDDSGVDIYQSVYGDINTPTGGILATIFPL